MFPSLCCLIWNWVASYKQAQASSVPYHISTGQSLQTLLTLPLQLLLIGFAGLVRGLQGGNAIFNLLQALLGFIKDQLGGTQVLLCLPQGFLGTCTRKQWEGCQAVPPKARDLGGRVGFP